MGLSRGVLPIVAISGFLQCRASAKSMGLVSREAIDAANVMRSSDPPRSPHWGCARFHALKQGAQNRTASLYSQTGPPRAHCDVVCSRGEK